MAKATKSKYLWIFFGIAFILTIVLVALYDNYSHGKEFKPCRKCDPNEVFFIEVNTLPDDLIDKLLQDINENGTKLHPERNFNNAQGKKANYRQLSPEIVNSYENDFYKDAVSKVVNEEVDFADNTEQYKIFARVYEDQNDFLDWHYDNNFTVGNRYTLVIPVLVDPGNTSEFMIRDVNTGEEKVIPIPIGKGVVYNGSITYHKITKQTDGNRRVVIIIPFYSNREKSMFGNIKEWVRNATDATLSL